MTIPTLEPLRQAEAEGQWGSQLRDQGSTPIAGALSYCGAIILDLFAWRSCARRVHGSIDRPVDGVTVALGAACDL